MKKKLFILVLVLAFAVLLAVPAMAADPIVLEDVGHVELALALQEASESYSLTGETVEVVVENATISLGSLPSGLGLWSTKDLDIDDGVTLVLRFSTICFTGEASDIHIWDGGTLVLDDGAAIEWGGFDGHIWVHNNFGDPGFFNARKGTVDRGANADVNGVNSIRNAGLIRLAFEGQIGEITTLTVGSREGSVEILPFADYSELDAYIAEAEALNPKDYTQATWAALEEALANAKGVYRFLEIEDQEIIDDAALALREALDSLLSVVNAKFVSIIETSKNSRVWVLTFTVEVVRYGDGATEVVEYSIDLSGNNANLDGTYTFKDDIYLAGYTLTYDIKGNASNIKAFAIAQR